MHIREVSTVSMKFGQSTVEIHAGSYWRRPPHLVGVKLAQEIDKPCDINLPIADYATPTVAAATLALNQCAERLALGEVLFVGCFGGFGRTGLFLALMAKASGEADPVGFIRSVYDKSAVETLEQRNFVDAFPIEQVAAVWNLAAQNRAKAMSLGRPKL